VTPITALVSRAILPRRFVHGVVRCCRFPGEESWLLSLLLLGSGRVRVTHTLILLGVVVCCADRCGTVPCIVTLAHLRAHPTGASGAMQV